MITTAPVATFPPTAMTLNRARPVMIARWLWVVAACVLGIVAVGGITRLTNSGLSITDWNPIFGFIPPMNDAQWQTEFAHYRASSQYHLLNQGMGLAAFKWIFFWEYIHRVLARLLGLVVLLPLIVFAWRRWVPRALLGRLALVVVLIPAQGTIGWLMVASGLVDGRDKVAPLMLAAHLTGALTLLGVIVWTALDCRLLARDPESRLARVRVPALVVIGLLATQIIYGALMAGLRAGVIANSWPLMNDHLFPRGVIWVGARSLVDNPYLVHFIHRWWAFGAFISLMWLARRVRRANRAASVAVHSSVGLQIILGILTVLSGVNIVLAVAHQLLGALTLASTIWAAHVYSRPAVKMTV